jgi:dTDP-4-dehydrorhamnose reductase
MLGQSVAKQLEALHVPWFGTDRELDISDEPSVRALVSDKRPTAIINCAAYTAVDAAEVDEASARRVNASGPQLLAQLCNEQRLALAHVSTDYVFDGERSGAHEVDAPVGPCNAYGRTKLEGERAILACFAEARTGARWWIIRTSWLFGHGRSSFVDTMWNLMLEKPELRVVDDQYGRPTYVDDLAKLLVRAIGVTSQPALASGVWHFANAEETTWFGLASEIRTALIEAGIAVRTQRVIPVSTSEFPRPARRPKNSVLSTRKLETEAQISPRGWRDALREYVESRVSNEVNLGNSQTR